MKRTLDGMVVVITGASAGIGLELAKALAPRGAQLVLAARRADRLDALNASLGGRHLCVPTDVGSRGQCEALIERATERFGRIDTLVCNAGYGFLRAAAETSPDDARAIFQTNVFGTLDCIRPAVPRLRTQDVVGGWRGQVMIVSSAVARRGLPYFGAYSATKAAQLSLAEAMRVELRDDRIAVTSVHPVGTDTEFGNVSANLSGGRRPTTHGEVRQSGADVARPMVRAIEYPRAEVWPLRPSRWLLSLGTLAPSLVDRLLSKRVRAE